MNKMNGEPIKILLVEDNPGGTRLLREALAEAGTAQFELVHVQRLNEALKRLAEGGMDVILLDLRLPDGHGLDTVTRAHAAAPDVPIVVLTGLNDEALAVQAVREGAQDYLVKDQMDSHLLVRAMRYAIERKRAEEALRRAHDELEIRIQERTAELANANEALQAEITERQQAEKALRESERRYRLLADNVTDVIWTTDMNLRPTYVSPSIVRQRGYSVEEAMARTVEADLTPASFEVAMKALAEELAIESMEHKDLSRSRMLEFELSCKDGSTIWAEAKMTFLHDSDGRPVGILGVSRDITERKRAEEALQRSEKYFRSLIENASDMILVLEADGTIRYQSPSTERVLGNKPEDSIGKSGFEFVHPDDLPNVMDAFTNATKNLSVTPPIELRVRHNDGSWRILEATGNNLLDDPAVVGIVVNCRDITEHKRRRELETLYQLAHDLAYSLDIRTIAEHLFERAKSLLGADYGFLMLANAEGSELRGVAAHGMDIETFHQERIDLRKELYPTFLAFQQRPSVMTADFARDPTVSERLRERYHFVKSVWGVPLMSGERAVGMFFVAYATRRAATAEELRLLQLLGDEAALAVERAHLTEELRESEELYRNLFENANDGIAIFALDGTPTSVNRALEVMLGWSREEMIGQHHRKFATPASAALAAERTRRALTGERLPSIFELELVRRGGSVVPVEARARFIRDQEGKPIGLQGIFRDISARKELDVERQLRQKFEELSHTNARLYGEVEQRRAELQRLSAKLRQAQESERRRIARELHDGVAQTLSGLFMYLDLLDNMVEGLPPARERLVQIKSLIEQTLQDVRGLAWTLRPTVLDDLGLPAALRWLVTNLSQSTPIGTALHIEESLSPLSSAVETALYRIVQEALANVFQHARASQVTVHLGTDNGALQLTVTDNGQGIDPTALSSASQDRRGIGLWSMRERAEEVGGTFSLCSSCGQGTSILVSIPVEMLNADG